MKWLKRQYESVGLTQYPTGQHLAAVRAQFCGYVILCLDVSGSMAPPDRLPRAIDGCHRFTEEALSNNYEVGIVFWNHEVPAAIGLTTDRDRLRGFLKTATAMGGNDIVPALRQADQYLSGFTGDRVVAIFGDGDLGNPTRAATAARQLVDKNIRILTCGLGEASARSLDEISTEERDTARVAETGEVAESLAGLASGLKRR